MRHLPTVLLLCLALAACGKDDAPTAADPAQANTDAAVAAANGVASSDDTPAVPELPPLPAGDFRIASVTLGTEVDAEGQVTKPLEAFAPGDRIHASVVGVGTSQGLTLSARWRAADGTEIAKAGQSLTPIAPTVTTFAIDQPAPWPVGEYTVDIAINDRVVETRAFRVE